MTGLPLSYELPNLATTLDAGELIHILAEAESGDTRRLFALYRDVLCDSHVQAELTKRKAAILADSATLIPWDKRSTADIAARDALEPLVSSRLFLDAEAALLDATLFPVSVLEKVFAPSSDPCCAHRHFRLVALRPVPMQLLDFTAGELRIYDTDSSGRPLLTSHLPDPRRYIVHRCGLLPIPDRWGGPMRAVLYWWLLRTMSRQWWAALLERFGTPFLVGKYEAGREGDKGALQSAFSMAVRLGGVVVTKGAEVELLQASQNDSGSAHGSFIALCNAEISRLIVGQTLSSTPAATGMGSGVAALQGEVRDDLRKMDAQMLAATLRDQLFTQMLEINGFTGHAPSLRLGVDSAAEQAATISLLGALSSAGLELDDEGLTRLTEQTGLTLRRKLEPTIGTYGGMGLGLSADATPARAPLASKRERLERLLQEEQELIAMIVASARSPEEAQRKLDRWLEREHPEAADLLADILSATARGALA